MAASSDKIASPCLRIPIRQKERNLSYHEAEIGSMITCSISTEACRGMPSIQPQEPHLIIPTTLLGVRKCQIAIDVDARRKKCLAIRLSLDHDLLNLKCSIRIWLHRDF